MNNTGRLGLALVALLSGSGAAYAQQFIPIPPLSGHSETYVRGVSGDGSIVVGTSGTYPDEKAFYWTAETGSVALETVGDAPSAAVAISADGITIVGTIDGAGVRWVDGVIDFLEGNDNYPFVIPTSVDAYGHSIGGSAYPLQGPFGIAIRWTTAGITDLGELTPDAFPLTAYGISDDATTLVGISSTEAFRWTEETEMVGLGFLPGFQDFSIATCVNGDGSVIAGQADINPDYAAAYWTEPTGWVEIPSIIASASVANSVKDVSADGNLMVGIDTGFSPFERELFIWDPVNGPRPLQETLEQEYGVDFLGWQLTGLGSPWENEGDVMGISSDGKAIVGVALNQQTQTRWGWIVILASCPADVDGSGVVDIDDIFAILGAWGPCDDCPEDVNDDGHVDIDDIFAVLAAWGPC